MNKLLQLFDLDDLFLQKTNLRNYKIDYKNPLGKGFFGAVYPLVRRPIDERNFFSRLNPLLYDKEYPFKATEERSDTGLCVKIFNGNMYTVRNHGPKAETHLHEVLRENDLTKIKFYEKGINYQIKTKVNGTTLSDHKRALFHDKKGYPFRKGLFNFLKRLIKKNYIKFNDHKLDNLMLTSDGRIEIIDGRVISTGNEPAPELQLKNFFSEYCWKNTIPELLADHLKENILDGKEYNQEIDEEYLEQVSYLLPQGLLSFVET